MLFSPLPTIFSLRHSTPHKHSAQNSKSSSFYITHTPFFFFLSAWHKEVCRGAPGTSFFSFLFLFLPFLYAFLPSNVPANFIVTVQYRYPFIPVVWMPSQSLWSYCFFRNPLHCMTVHAFLSLPKPSRMNTKQVLVVVRWWHQ